MNQTQKDKFLAEAESHAQEITRQAAEAIPRTEADVERATQELLSARLLDEKIVKRIYIDIANKKLEGLKNAADSPYFSRCDISREGETKSLYFGKFYIPEFDIYSWVAPAAKLRFEKPGSFAYVSEAGKEIQGMLARNDQYLIAKGHVTFMATATEETPRTLVYQEHFSNRKSSFVLPEIVERMEKAQDEVIRADYQGSFLISGPAGSGKTTLALHRIAYLLQAPETAAKFKAKDILVLVQDDSTKQYFDELLPSLGIKDVAITTFAAWAKTVLNLPDFTFGHGYGQTEAERDAYAFAKNQALKSAAFPVSSRSPFVWLESFYSKHFIPEQIALFRKQKRDKALDRFDLTALLQARIQSDGALTQENKVYNENVFGIARSRWITSPIQYSLILIDEVQNYLPEQIHIIRSCISPKTQAMTYIGDLAQQTSLFTLKDWGMVGESFAEGRAIKLDKVYRSSRQILEYIRSVGFEIDIPEGVREGKAVEKRAGPVSEWLSRAEEIIKENRDVLVGILGITPESIRPLLPLTAANVRVMTVAEAQGVEFDVVIFINQNIEIGPGYPEEIRGEKVKVVRDQLYVGLTRAMNALYVFGDSLRGQ